MAGDCEVTISKIRYLFFEEKKIEQRSQISQKADDTMAFNVRSIKGRRIQEPALQATNPVPPSPGIVGRQDE